MVSFALLLDPQSPQIIPVCLSGVFFTGIFVATITDTIEIPHTAADRPIIQFSRISVEPSFCSLLSKQQKAHALCFEFRFFRSLLCHSEGLSD